MINKKRGLTLIEVSVSLTIFGVLGIVLMQALDLSQGSHKAVANVVNGNEILREAADGMGQDLRVSANKAIMIEDLPDGNHEVTFRHPIVDGGHLKWGVPTSEIGKPNDPDLLGWSFRYTVQEQGEDQVLLRQIINKTGGVHSEDVIARGVRPGTVDPPGFQVVKTGDVWEVTLSVSGHGEWSEVFHVWMRN